MVDHLGKVRYLTIFELMVNKDKLHFTESGKVMGTQTL